MPARSGSNLARVSTGMLNRVMDAVIGQTSVPLGTGNSKYGNQLGAEIELDNASALMLSDPAIGTLFGGTYRYVRFRAADLANTFKRGMLVFTDSAANQQVTSTEALATATGIAGVVLNPTTGNFAVVPGNYGWIYCGGGNVTMQWKAALTVAAAVGLQVQWSAAGAGADNGTVDTLAVATTVSLAKYIGQAETLPVAGGLTTVYQPFVRRRIS
jgi:hypothetical protein